MTLDGEPIQAAKEKVFPTKSWVPTRKTKGGKTIHMGCTTRSESIQSPPHTNTLLFHIEEKYNTNTRNMLRGIDIHMRANYLRLKVVVEHMEDVNLDLPENSMDVEWDSLVLELVPSIPNVVDRCRKGDPAGLPQHTRACFVPVAIPDSSKDGGDTPGNVDPILDKFPNFNGFRTVEE